MFMLLTQNLSPRKLSLKNKTMQNNPYTKTSETTGV